MAASYLLLQDGSKLLLQNGDRIILIPGVDEQPYLLMVGQPFTGWTVGAPELAWSVGAPIA